MLLHKETEDDLLAAGDTNTNTNTHGNAKASAKANPEQSSSAHDSDFLASINNNNPAPISLISPMEFEASTQRQKRLLRSIHVFAVGICALVAIGIGVICYTSPANANANGATLHEHEHDAFSLPRVKQPNKKVDETREQEQHETLIRKLEEEFHEWAKKHGRDYTTDSEKKKRFNIWKDNHFKTQEKNERHGPCKLTGQTVFGENHFKDLTSEEFQSRYLTGYTGPRTDEIPNNRRRLRTDQYKQSFKEDIMNQHPTTKRRVEPTRIISSNGLHDPSVLSDNIRRHESVQQRYLKHIQDAPILDKTYYSREEKNNERTCKCGSSYSNRNRNRFLKKLAKAKANDAPKFGKTYYNKSEKQYVCGYSKTYYNRNSSSSSQTVDCSKYKLEAGKDYETSDSYNYSNPRCEWYDMSCFLKTIFSPIYTSSEAKYTNYNYPSKIDWRELGAITSVHSQGSCGACWAITAVETIESVTQITTGTLLDLSESEVIICDTTCEMCEGGWPQNAYEYVMENNGLPLEKTLPYDGDYLMTMTTVKAGESDEITSDQMESIYTNTCPANENGNGNSSGNSSGNTRYGAISGYAYATDRCICYTDGSGCDCDEQNEALAVMNVASFGPATVCLEASTWQDYSGGVITADSGCQSGFMDMNHCVQAVGYAFQEVSDEYGYDADEKNGSGDGDNKNSDSTRLEGYWIIRNQWSSYWGMSGYAFVAMGSNTCGVLNDMTQVFMDD